MFNHKQKQPQQQQNEDDRSSIDGARKKRTTIVKVAAADTDKSQGLLEVAVYSLSLSLTPASTSRGQQAQERQDT